jgi:glycosyltransferase involved in cell wall biosynthesis
MCPSIEVVIPVLNEEETLENQIQKLVNYLQCRVSQEYSYQITIANNGSTDATLIIANSLAARFENVRVVTVDRRGVGLALKTAWQNSKCDYVGYLDLDFSTDLNHIRDVEIFLTEGNECVFGSRLLPQSKVSGRSIKRTLISIVFNSLIRIIFDSTTSDGMCGFKFIRKNQLTRILQNGAECDGWFFCTELAVVAQKVGCKIIEIPVKWQDDKNSKVQILSLAYEYILDIIAFKNRISKLSKAKKSL